MYGVEEEEEEEEDDFWLVDTCTCVSSSITFSRSSFSSVSVSISRIRVVMSSSSSFCRSCDRPDSQNSSFFAPESWLWAGSLRCSESCRCHWVLSSWTRCLRSLSERLASASRSLLAISSSCRNTSMMRQLSVRLSAVVYRVRNQLDAYMDVWKLCDWKCRCSSGICSCTMFSSWYMHRPSSAIEGLNMSRIRYCCIICTNTANASSSGICVCVENGINKKGKLEICCPGELTCISSSPTMKPDP
uniref:Uncharacterized protein n=1 Tax=Anopheles coluzzii TaxID=1518534 RepID=A0A8W7PT49_ANOCL